MKLFHAAGPLYSARMDFLTSLRKTAQEHDFIVVANECSTKMMLCISSQSVAKAIVSPALPQYCGYAEGAPEQVLKENGKQFAAKVFYSKCEILSSKFTIPQPAICRQKSKSGAHRCDFAATPTLCGRPQNGQDPYLQLAYSYNKHAHQTNRNSTF